MKIKRGFCCCHSCKAVFDSEADYLLHLSCDGYCRRGADRVVRDIARIILFSGRWHWCVSGNELNISQKLHIERGKFKNNVYSRTCEILRNQPSDYPRLLWVILVFFGGVVDALTIKAFIDYVLPIYQYTIDNKTDFTSIANWQILTAVIIVYGIAVFLVPIGYSFFFSSGSSERKLIPPLYTQMVSFGLLVYFFYDQVFASFPILYFVGFYVVVGGITQDGIVTSALGKTALPNDIMRHSFIVHANMERVRELIISKQFQRLYRLKTTKTEAGETAKLRSRQRRGFTLVLELREGKRPDRETILNIVFYDLGSYRINPMETDKRAR
jgi:hypothetical protein